MRSVRVLMVNKFLYRRAGAEIYMLDLAAELERAGAQCRFFAMQDPRNAHSADEHLFPPAVDFEQPSGAIDRLRAGGRALYSIRARRGMAQLLASQAVDVVHLHNIYHQLSPAVLAPARQAGIPIVMTVHDYKLVCPVYTLMAHGRECTRCVGGHFRHAVANRCNRGSVAGSVLVAAESRFHRTLRLYLNGIDTYITPSRYAERMLVQGGYPADRVEVIPNFAAPPGGAPAPLGRSILYAGRLAETKGIDVLLEAAGDDLELRIAGDGPERARLERMAERRRARVTFLGRLDRDRLEQEYRGARVVVAPSVWPENCPLGVLEAMSRGRPVVASDVGGLPELVAHNQTGLLVRPRDPSALRAALVELTTDERHARALGEAARRRAAREFSSDQHVRRVMAVYRRLLARVPTERAG